MCHSVAVTQNRLCLQMAQAMRMSAAPIILRAQILVTVYVALTVLVFYSLSAALCTLSVANPRNLIDRRRWFRRSTRHMGAAYRACRVSWCRTPSVSRIGASRNHFRWQPLYVADSANTATSLATVASPTSAESRPTLTVLICPPSASAPRRRLPGGTGPTSSLTDAACRLSHTYRREA